MYLPVASARPLALSVDAVGRVRVLHAGCGTPGEREPLITGGLRGVVALDGVAFSIAPFAPAAAAAAAGEEGAAAGRLRPSEEL